MTCHITLTQGHLVVPEVRNQKEEWVIPSLDIPQELEDIGHRLGEEITVDTRAFPEVTLIICDHLRTNPKWKVITVFVGNTKEQQEVCELLLSSSETKVFTVLKRDEDDDEEVHECGAKDVAEPSHSVHWHPEENTLVATGTHHGGVDSLSATSNNTLTIIGLNRAHTTAVLFRVMCKYKHEARVRVTACHLTPRMVCLLLTYCASLDLSRTARIPRSVWHTLEHSTIHSLSLRDTYTDDYRAFMMAALKAPDLKRLGIACEGPAEDFSFLGELFLRAYTKFTCFVVEVDTAASFGSYIAWNSIHRELMTKGRDLKPGILVYPLSRREIVNGMTNGHEIMHRLWDLGRALHEVTCQEYQKKNPYEGFMGFRDVHLGHGLHSS